MKVSQAAPHAIEMQARIVLQSEAILDISNLSLNLVKFKLS